MTRAPFKKKSGPESVDHHVGIRLKQRRQELGLSLEYMAQSADVTFQQMGKYEKAENRISASRLHKLCKTLGVDANYFFEGL